MSKTIAITGANSFIGNALVRALLKKNYLIKALVRQIPTDKLEGVLYHSYQLDGDIDEAFFSDVEVCIHLAFQYKKQENNGEDVNILAIKNLKKLRLSQYIFISSFAAAEPVTDSYYGKYKFEAESFFNDDLIIRPALVLGNGGLFGRLQAQLSKIRFVPLLNGGKQIIQTIFIDDLVNAIIFLMENEAKGIFHIAHPTKVFYKDFMNDVAKNTQNKIVFIHIPVWFMQLLTAILQLLPNPPIKKDNLTGLLASKYIDTSREQSIMPQKWLSISESLVVVVSASLNHRSISKTKERKL
ncbi:NAD-dependent epimerase/dehydratase family protein [Emticicia sp. SJ17W-69]|uniref:NAD-dependent epimerase/dehydratase family protein n=1 Tax=Emticicia sp. SJ17W-69 TaxID=3421657 RepID=UPI003EC052AE